MKPLYDNDAVAKLSAATVEILQSLGVSCDTASPRVKAPPKNLCPRCAAEAAAEFRRAVKIFGRRQKKGRRVWHVTLVHPNWQADAGALTPEMIISFRAWVARRARRLATHGRYRALGVVDISWNDGSRLAGTSQWNVHAHLLVSVSAPPAYNVKQLLRDVFHIEPDADRGVSRPVKVQLLATDEDVRNAGAYSARRHFSHILSRRVSERGDDGHRNTRDRPLKVKQEKELLQVLLQTTLRNRTILSGLTWQGHRIVKQRQTYAIKPHPKYLPAASRVQKP